MIDIWVGHAVGGRGGERLLDRLGIAVSDDTILRLLKRQAAEPPPTEVLHVVGIDDWAWQKGQQHFGTILVDLERRRVIDVLGVRTAEAVGAGLAAHPGITTISRDRHGPYAEAVRRGAPHAREVADRFHLVRNLREAVEQELSRLRRCLIVSHGVPAAVATTSSDPRRVARRVPHRSAVADQQQQVAQEQRAVQLQRFALAPVPSGGHAPITFVPIRHISPQIAAALLAKPRALLTDRQAETVDTLKRQCPEFTQMRRLMLSFGTILRVGTVSTLHRWLEEAHATNLHALQRFVRKLRQDLSAVEGAVTERWSNGPVEGHINRLKTLKRQMYGRAGVALLRARLLPLPAVAVARS